MNLTRLEFTLPQVYSYLMVSPHHNLKEERQRYLAFCSSLATIFSLSFLFALKVRESKPQRKTRSYFYHYSYSDKVYRIISLCCSCLFCRGILISFGMSKNKSYIIGQEVSFTTKISGHVQICQLHLNMRQPGLQAKHKGEGMNKCPAGDQKKVEHPCICDPAIEVYIWIFDPNKPKDGGKMEKFLFNPCNSQTHSFDLLYAVVTCKATIVKPNYSPCYKCLVSSLTWLTTPVHSVIWHLNRF